MLKYSPMSNIKLPNAYLSHDVYKQLIDENHFLVKLGTLFDWYALVEPLNDLGENDHGGRPRYPAVLMLKMLFISFIFNRSDRETEEEATNHLVVKYFLRLPIDEKAPDHTSLCRFRETVLKKKGMSFFTDLFRSILSQAKEKGVRCGVVSALDATHTFAKVDAKKPQDPTTPHDPDASWGCKGLETKTTDTGQKVHIPKYFFGYKAHLLAETTKGIITGLYATEGKTADIDGGDMLIHRILTNEERKQIDFLTADKGYGCPVWINMLEKYTGITTAFSLPDTMTKKGKHKEKWRAYMKNDGRTTFRKERTVIERVNGDLKDNHGLRKCRYLGLAKYHLQLAMSSMAHNFKIFVTLLSGARLKPI